jgi:hypothetical protein
MQENSKSLGMKDGSYHPIMTEPLKSTHLFLHKIQKINQQTFMCSKYSSTQVTLVSTNTSPESTHQTHHSAPHALYQMTECTTSSLSAQATVMNATDS